MVKSSLLKKIALYFFAAVFLAFTTVPYIMIVILGFLPESDIIKRPPIPFKVPELTLSNYIYILSYEPFTKGFLYSAITALATVSLVLLVGSMGAYAVARMRFRGRGMLFNAMVIIYMLPALAMLIPIIVLLKVFGLLDTLLGMILAHCILLLPMMTWFMVGIYEGVPADIDAAVQIEGYSRWEALFKINMPLCRLGVFLVLVFSFVLSWSDLMFANTVGVTKVRLLQPTILEFMGAGKILYGQLAAAGTLSSLPVVVLAIVLQKQIIAGIMKGAIK